MNMNVRATLERFVEAGIEIDDLNRTQFPEAAFDFFENMIADITEKNAVGQDYLQHARGLFPLADYLLSEHADYFATHAKLRTIGDFVQMVTHAFDRELLVYSEGKLVPRDMKIGAAPIVADDESDISTED